MTRVVPHSDIPIDMSAPVAPQPKVLLLTHHAARSTDLLMVERKCGKTIKIVCTSVTEAIVDIGKRDVRGVGLIFLEANLGMPGETKSTITPEMLRNLFKTLPGVHIRFFSGGTMVEISELLESLTDEEKGNISSGLGEANFGTVTTPTRFCSPRVGTRSSAAMPDGPLKPVVLATPPKRGWGCCFFKGSIYTEDGPAVPAAEPMSSTTPLAKRGAE